MAIDSASVPIATSEARRGEALRWGDDYQLLFTLPAGVDSPVPAHCIGRVMALSDAPILLDGVPLSEGDGVGYRHG